ncbi:group II truncated hemoglobin [Methylophaga sp. OBS4]|uniref:group II truncated hemoglobin n=1 Tax=Methylophaga sp. OBS4 TaxID=2991935 RepID=UPI002259927D|nr:group II truncated hemoglobin [Methylophaga sp. OBS4]MCX4187104.1 group II truncated hemoglobin [Methylophaga sp. OBS4]
MEQVSAQRKRISIYDQIGQAEGVQQLVNTFCELLETTETGKPVYLLHLRGHGMAHARMEQFSFFCGMFGGPQLYAEKWGHSDVRKIHAHVDIDEALSQAWLSCMDMALDKLAYPADLKQQLMCNFTDMAALLVKQPSH